MKILHIDTGKEWRGGQRQVFVLHKLLLEKGIDSHLVCNIRGELLKHCHSSNLINLYPAEYKSEFSFEQYSQVISDVNPDILHSHDGHAVAIGAKHRKSRLHFSTRRVSYPIKLLSRFRKYSKVHVHVGVSPVITEYLSKYFKNTYTIDSCIETSRFSIEHSNPMVKHEGVQILYVGAFSPQKGVDVLLNSAKLLKNSGVSFHLHLVGGGELLEEMKNLSIENNIAGDCTFYGARKDVEGFYQHCQLVVVPSVDGEGSNGVIKEGMACGKTVIASDLKENAGLGDVDKNMYLFRNRDSEELFSKIKDTIKNNKMFNQEEVIANSMRFECQNTVEKYINLYKKFFSEQQS